MNLTEIKAAVEGDELRDDEVRGLQLRVRGGNRAFYLYYRTNTGQRRRPKIGDFPAITLPKAREIAREWLGEVARGKDPSGERSALRASETVSDLADRFLAERTEKASYRHDKGRVENVVKPRWGKLRVPEVSTTDLHALRREMRSKPIAFNRMMALISGMWKFGEYPSILGNVKRYPENKRKRYLTEEERERFLAALDETEPQYPHAIALIRLLYLTGARFSEIARAKRSWLRIVTVDGERRGELHLAKHKTSAKTGGKVIALTDEALSVVEATDPRRGALIGFASVPWQAWEKVRERAELEDFTLHDLRHSFASDAIGAGHSLDEIGEALGHNDAATTKRYAHLSEPKKFGVAKSVATSRKKPTLPKEV